MGAYRYRSLEQLVFMAGNFILVGSIALIGSADTAGRTLVAVSVGYGALGLLRGATIEPTVSAGGRPSWPVILLFPVTAAVGGLISLWVVSSNPTESRVVVPSLAVVGLFEGLRWNSLSAENSSVALRASVLWLLLHGGITFTHLALWQLSFVSAPGVLHSVFYWTIGAIPGLLIFAKRDWPRSERSFVPAGDRFLGALETGLQTVGDALFVGTIAVTTGPALAAVYRLSASMYAPANASISSLRTAAVANEDLGSVRGYTNPRLLFPVLLMVSVSAALAGILPTGDFESSQRFQAALALAAWVGLMRLPAMVATLEAAKLRSSGRYLESVALKAAVPSSGFVAALTLGGKVPLRFVILVAAAGGFLSLEVVRNCLVGGWIPGRGSR